MSITRYNVNQDWQVRVNAGSSSHRKRHVGIPFVVPGVFLVDRATLLLVVVFWHSSGLVKVDSGVVQVSPMLVAVLSSVVEQ